MCRRLALHYLDLPTLLYSTNLDQQQPPEQMNKAIPHSAFEHLRTGHIASLDIELHEFRHKATGTPHIHLAADNPENVFLVGLRTIPEDSTGVAHILEHTVLCGSERYPVRDPFFMMIRRSLNTFMNAFTSSDWTAYPFASQNRKDYFNLLDVYLDAVFFSRLHELDFMQEGHRVEFETPDDPSSDLVFKGVVFNEMKGAMSSPSSLLWQTLSKHLFPNNTYHHNSGGDPEAIPDLDHKALLEFYQTHYHPSNAVFMTYGNIAPDELQERFDTLVLSRFDALDQTVAVAPARRIHAPMRVEEAYAVQDEETADRTHVVVGWLLGNSIDLDERLRAHLLSSVLLDNSASPLMQALEQSDLGSSPSPLCGLEDSALEMVFVCGLEGSERDHSEAIETMINTVLEKVAAEGIDRAQVDAVLHQLELSQREIRGDGMPFGLQLVLSGLSTAMQRGDAFAAIDLDPALERLRRDAESADFIPRLVHELLLDNPHRVTLTLRPDTQVSARRQTAEVARLARMKAALNDEESGRIVSMAAALAERQQQEDDPDILPKVTREDVPAELHIPAGQARDISGAPGIIYAQGTNGLAYAHAAITLPALEPELLQLMPLYTSMVTELGSGGRDYAATQVRQAEVTGGIGAYTIARGSVGDEQQTSAQLIFRGKALVRNGDALHDILLETIDTVRFDEHQRIRELVAQMRSGREQSVTGSGHALAMMAASSGMSPASRWSHQLNGLAGIKTLKQLDESLDDATEGAANLERLAERLATLNQHIQNAPRQYMTVAEADRLDSLVASLAARVPATDAAASAQPLTLEPVREKSQQLWTTNTEVNFCARAFPTVPSAHEDSAALTVLGAFLRNGFLHRAIRETGGAYGGGASHDADSASFRFFSYRDPRLTDTLADFDASIDWLVSTTHHGRDLDEAVLNIISSIDKPGSPAGEARTAWQAELFGRTAERRRTFRQQILDVSLHDLKRVGETWLVPEKASTGVVTSESLASSATGIDNLQRHEL